MSKMMIPKIP